jgi:hypothetical protein
MLERYLLLNLPAGLKPIIIERPLFSCTISFNTDVMYGHSKALNSLLRAKLNLAGCSCRFVKHLLTGLWARKRLWLNSQYQHPNLNAVNP